MNILSFCPSKRQAFGATIEGWVLQQLRARGIEARMISDWTNHFDLVIDGEVPTPVEVKGARLGWRRPRPGYLAPVWRWFTGNIDQTQDYLLALVAEDPDGHRHLYLVPSWAAWGRSGLSLTSHPDCYNGRLAKYRDNWAVVGQVTNRRQQNIKTKQLSFMGV